MDKSGLKDPANMGAATSYAEKCRMAPANSAHKTPPKGPKAEPVRLNGVKPPRESGVKY